MASEKHLIDADALMAEVKRTAEITKRRREQFSLRNLIMCIKNAPTVDAVEVVHGRWEDMWDGKYANPRYRCSVCKEKANYKSVQDELLSWHDVQVLTPYCPYCLAKLDGGIDNDIKTV